MIVTDITWREEDVWNKMFRVPGMKPTLNRSDILEVVEMLRVADAALLRTFLANICNMLIYILQMGICAC